MRGKTHGPENTHHELHAVCRSCVVERDNDVAGVAHDRVFNG